MSTEMLDRLQEARLQGLEALIHSYESATATGGGEDEAAAIADFFIDVGIGARQSSQRLSDYYWAKALAAKIADRQERGAKLRSLLERGGSIVRSSAQIARAYADFSGHDVTRLALLEEKSKAFPRWLQECVARLEMLDRPRRPLHRERIAESEAAYQRGEGEAVSDVIARFESGGPLV